MAIKKHKVTPRKSSLLCHHGLQLLAMYQRATAVAFSRSVKLILLKFSQRFLFRHSMLSVLNSRKTLLELIVLIPFFSCYHTYKCNVYMYETVHNNEQGLQMQKKSTYCNTVTQTVLSFGGFCTLSLRKIKKVHTYFELRQIFDIYFETLLLRHKIYSISDKFLA